MATTVGCDDATRVVNQIVDDAQTHDASALCVLHSRLFSPVRLNTRARASGGVARRTRRRLAR